MKSDAFFVKGQSHDICQDYAIARGNVIAISDGCSIINDGKCHKHPNSDIASRVVCTLMTEYNRKRVEKLARFLSNILRISLDATSISVQEYPSNSRMLLIEIIGDGVVFIDFKNGKKEIHVTSYEPNTPVYVSYLLSQNRRDSFNKNLPLTIDDIYYINADWTIEKIDHADSNQFPSLKKLEKTFFGIMEEITSISIFSDGVTDIHTPNGKMPVTEAVKALTSFKRTNGEFVLARMKVQLREWASQGIYPNDDLSMATLIID